MKWQVLKFGQLAEIQPAVKLERGKGYPFIAMEVLEPRHRYITRNEIRIWDGGGGARFRDGDTIFARITPCLEHGKTAQIFGLSEEVGFGSTEFLVFRSRPGISDPNFIYYLACSNLIREPAIKSMIGASGRQRAKRAVIEDITLRVPLLPVQREIASVLSPYDDLIANNRRRIQLLEESAQLLYKEWFVYLRFPGHEHVKIVDGVPKGWIKTTIADLCDSVNYGYTASATAEPVGPKFLRITDIVPDVINWSSVPFCSIPENKKEQFLLKEGDVVVARTGATTGYAKRIGKTHPKTVFASYLIRLRLKSEIDDMLVGIFVESDDYKSYIKAQVGGAAQPNANAKIISSAKILIPPNNIQRYFHEMIEPIFECKDNLQAQNEKLTQARDLLLPRLMNGEIAV